MVSHSKPQVRMVKLILYTRSAVGDVENGFVCFACREREEMKGELGILQQYASWWRR